MRALILGVLGQDGSYLAEQLLADGHDVHGMVRRSNVTSPAQLHMGDLLDQDSIESTLKAAKPDVVFNLAAVTSPGGSWGTPQPPLLADVTGVGVVRVLDAMLRCAPDAHLVHASSSAVFDPARYGLYGAAKVLAHNAVIGYRSVLRCSNAVLYSHTSPRQDPKFLARRICSTIARIAAGSTEHLRLGDVQSRRDWGYAPDYMRALALIAEQEPRDWVVCTGEQHSVRDLVGTALDLSGLTCDVLDIDPAAQRVPDERPPSLSIASVSALGWKPETSFTEMVAALLERELSWR